jgi:hypothetical protein
METAHSIHHKDTGLSTEVPWEFRKRGQDWSFLGEEISCIPDPVYPYSQEIVRAIQSFLPTAVPIWILSAYLAPSGGIVVFGRHGLAERVGEPKKRYRELEAVLLPTDKHWSRPNKVICVLEDANTPDVIPGIGVKPYLPWGWHMVDQIRKQWRERQHEDYAHDDERWAERTALAAAESQAKKAERNTGIAQADADYIFDDHWKGRNLASEVRDLTSSEWNALGARSNPAVTVKGVA